MAGCLVSLLVELSRPIQRVGTCCTGVAGVRSSYAPLGDIACYGLHQIFCDWYTVSRQCERTPHYSSVQCTVKWILIVCKYILLLCLGYIYYVQHDVICYNWNKNINWHIFWFTRYILFDILMHILKMFEQVYIQEYISKNKFTQFNPWSRNSIKSW